MKHLSSNKNINDKDVNTSKVNLNNPSVIKNNYTKPSIALKVEENNKNPKIQSQEKLSYEKAKSINSKIDELNLNLTEFGEGSKSPLEFIKNQIMSSYFCCSVNKMDDHLFSVIKESLDVRSIIETTIKVNRLSAFLIDKND